MGLCAHHRAYGTTLIGLQPKTLLEGVGLPNSWEVGYTVFARVGGCCAGALQEDTSLCRKRGQPKLRGAGGSKVCATTLSLQEGTHGAGTEVGMAAGGGWQCRWGVLWVPHRLCIYAGGREGNGACPLLCSQRNPPTSLCPGSHSGVNSSPSPMAQGFFQLLLLCWISVGHLSHCLHRQGLCFLQPSQNQAAEFSNSRIQVLLVVRTHEIQLLWFPKPNVIGICLPHAAPY